MLKKSILFLFLLSFTALTFAQPYVRITNKTGYDIWHIYVSPEDSDEWEEDMLDDDEVLEHGESIRVTLRGYDTDIFDIRLVDEDGDSYEKYDINIDREDAIFSSRDMVD